VIDVTPTEVKQLWWFLDGAIMAPSTREELRKSWGFCPRHAWGLSMVEVELRGGSRSAPRSSTPTSRRARPRHSASGDPGGLLLRPSGCVALVDA
jgi:hypothetical protein